MASEASGTPPSPNEMPSPVAWELSEPRSPCGSTATA